MKKCPKCGYERTPKDDEFISAEECPKCGVIYEKEIAYIAKQKEMAEKDLLKAEEESRRKHENLIAEEKLKAEMELKEAAIQQKNISEDDVRFERIVVETDLYRMEGDIALPPGGYSNALFDMLNRNEDEFISLTNVELAALDGSGRNWNSPVLDLAKRQIRLVMPQKPS